MSRRAARKHAFLLVFQMEFAKPEEMEELLQLHFSNMANTDTYDKEFIIREVRGVCEHKQDLDEHINNCATGWTIDRMPKTDISILRLASYEMLYSKDIPESVSINEAVELAKRFSGEEAPSFINGILGKLSKELGAV